jgi:hypothetical protein
MGSSVVGVMVEVLSVGLLGASIEGIPVEVHLDILV